MNVRMVDAAVERIRQADILALVADATGRPAGAGERFVLARWRRRRAPSARDQQGRPGHEGVAAAAHGALEPAARLRRHRPGVGADRRERRSAGAGAAGAPARGRPALSRRTTSPTSPSGSSWRRSCARRCCGSRTPRSRSRARWSSTGSRSRTRRGCMRLYCSILVERESQKPILIGRGGEMIKRIGTAARQELETLLRRARVPGPAGEGEGGVARGRPAARRARLAPGRPVGAARHGRVRSSARAVMPLYKTDALILRTYKLGEADRIVVFLTRDRGKKRGVANGARRPPSPVCRGARAADAGRRRPTTNASSATWCGLSYAEPQCSPLLASSAGRARPRRLLRRADRRVGAGGRPERAAVPPGRLDVDALAAGVPTAPLARYFEYLAAAAPGGLPAARRLPSVRRRARRGGDRRVARAGRARVHLPRLHRRRRRGVSLSPDALAFLRRRGACPRCNWARCRCPRGWSANSKSVHRALMRLHLEKELRSTRVLRDLRHERGAVREAAPASTSDGWHDVSRSDPQALGVLGLPRLPPPAAARPRGRGRHVAPRDVPARARSGALERRLRPAVAAPRRRPLRGEPEPPVQAPPVPGHPEAGPGRGAAALPARASRRAASTRASTTSASKRTTGSRRRSGRGASAGR